MKKKNNCEKLRIFVTVFSIALLMVALISGYACKWYLNTFDSTTFESILVTLLGNNKGTETGILLAYVKQGLIPALIMTVLLFFLLFKKYRKKIVLTFCSKYRVKLFPLPYPVTVILSTVISVILIGYSAYATGLSDYIKYMRQDTKIFEKEYADPNIVKITFPEQKRNLIYIFLESVETTFFSKEEGGSLDTNQLPELYAMAEKNINFSHNDGVGGFSNMIGSTWTIGAMVSQTSGLPLKMPVGIDGYDLADFSNITPGATTLSDVLNENGYYQALMVGSDSTFGGRRAYYTQHGTDMIYDHHTAQPDGIIPLGYNVWWGFEDKRLFEYAKRELTEIAAKDQPFAFTLLTADTHFPDGYQCEYCENNSQEQYENVYACSSKQVAEFVEWIKKQPFYENTAIVLAGDHLTMDHAYIERASINEDDRKIYNCFINSSATPINSKNRQFTSFDLFPSTLAAMGCTVEGDRLGIGVNLFSDKKTLAEIYGVDQMYTELQKHSSFYNKNILFNN